VPAELTRAALRQAWANDPAIRDFNRHRRKPMGFQRPECDTGLRSAAGRRQRAGCSSAGAWQARPTR
jgi:hypothetical protein